MELVAGSSGPVGAAIGAASGAATYIGSAAIGSGEESLTGLAGTTVTGELLLAALLRLLEYRPCRLVHSPLSGPRLGFTEGWLEDLHKAHQTRLGLTMEVAQAACRMAMLANPVAVRQTFH